MTADTNIISFLQLVSLTCTSLPSLIRGRMMGLEIISHILSRWQLDSKLMKSHCPIYLEIRMRETRETSGNSPLVVISNSETAV